jgi:predicted alpha/beta superfamily hydrolase
VWQDLPAEPEAVVKPVILTFFALFISTVPAWGLEIERHRIESAVLGESREYLIYLPPSYDDPEIEPRSYPVLLLLDGEAYTPTLAGILHFMASEAVYTFQVPEMIIVGIPHPDRLRDLTPVPGTKLVDGSPLTGSERTGGGEKLLEFLRNELMKEVDQRWRTLPFRVLIGHSTGGLLAVWDLTSTRPVANAHIAIDPSLWWSDAAALERIKRLTGKKTGHWILYLARAGHSSIAGVDDDAHSRALDKAVVRFKKARGESIFFYRRFAEDAHDTVALPAFSRGLEFIFNGYRPDFGAFYSDPDRIEAHYDALATRIGFELPPPENLFAMLAGWAASSGDPDKAVRFRKIAVKFYPNSWPACEALYHALLEVGDPTAARRAIETFLESVPGHQEAVLILRTTSPTNP